MSDQALTPNEQQELENLKKATRDDVRFQKMLKFKKGDYFCGEEQIPLGTVYLAHTKSLVKTYIHFVDKKVVERKIYRAALGETCPDRHEIPDNDESLWPKDAAGKPQDPWPLQYLVPFENMENGDVHIFVGQSVGGRRAIIELVDTYLKRASRERKTGQPIIKLATTTFPSKNWGDVKAPLFDIIGWDDTVAGAVAKQVDLEAVKKAEFNDEIPF